MFENTVVCGHIVLGKQGENHARKISFTDAKVWVNMFGEGRFELLHQRNGDSVPYPIKLNTEGDVPQWHISSVDTAIAGNGECELRYIVGDTIVKSCTFITEVAPGLAEGIEVPDPFKAWIDEVIEVGNAVLEASEGINESAERASESAVQASMSANMANNASTSANNSASSAFAYCKDAESFAKNAEQSKNEIMAVVGDINTALDNIIAMQNNLIGGDA